MPLFLPLTHTSYTNTTNNRAPIIVPSPPIITPMYPSTGIMVAPGAAAVAVSSGPDIVDIAIVSLFLVMAAGAATSALRGGDVDSDDYDAGRPFIDCVFLCFIQSM